MRPWRHLTFIYIYNRVKEIIYQKKYSDHPWLTKSANLIIKSIIKKTDIGLEFGSGRSTIWFARHVSFLTSVENDKFWYEKVHQLILEKNINNINYIYCEEDIEEGEGDIPGYVQIIQTFSPNSLDFVLVDGIYRSYCALSVLNLIKPGGLLILDNANWYLPCDSKSPNSRTWEEGPASPEWAEFLRSVKDWRCIWTSSGVTDTALYLKPCH